MTLNNNLTQRYLARTTLNLTNGVLTVMFQNSQYDSLAEAARAKFAWGVARSAYAQLPARDSITGVNVGFASVHGGMGLTFSRTDVPYGWSADVLRRGGVTRPPIADQASAGPAASDGADSAGCDFVPATAHASADTLLREFLVRDGEGQFLHSSGWLDSATTCPGHLPGPDAFVVVGGYTISDEPSSGDTARYRVVYQHLGYASATGTRAGSAGGWATFQPHAQGDTAHFVLVHSTYGWRIASPELPLYVLARNARPMLLPTDRARLDSTVRLAPQ